MNYQFQCPEQKRVRLIVDTDAKNEADDQFAIVHQILTPKFDIKGFIAAHFEHPFETEFFKTIRNIPQKATMEESYKELRKIMDIMGKDYEHNIFRGATNALPDENSPVVSEGAKLIVEEAMKNDDRPLFVVFLGAITDLASAYLMEPEIAKRLTAVWIGGGVWPEGGPEFNLYQDINAANVVFSSEIPFWQIPMNAYRQIRTTFAELQLKVRPYGEIGKYLFEQMVQYNNEWAECSSFPQGESWVLGDQPTVSVILESHAGMYEMKPAPRVGEDMRYIHGQNNRKIRVYNSIDSRMTLEDFFAKLAINFPKN